MLAGLSEEPKCRKGFFQLISGSSTTMDEKIVSNCSMAFYSVPFVEQIVALFPTMFIASLLHGTHTCSFSKIGIPSHLFIELTIPNWKDYFSEMEELESKH